MNYEPTLLSVLSEIMKYPLGIQGDLDDNQILSKIVIISNELMKDKKIIEENYSVNEVQNALLDGLKGKIQGDLPSYKEALLTHQITLEKINAFESKNYDGISNKKVILIIENNLNKEQVQKK